MTVQQADNGHNRVAAPPGSRRKWLEEAEAESGMLVQPVLRRLMPSLAGMLVLLFALGLFSLWQQHSSNMERRIGRVRQHLAASFRQDLRVEAEKMERMLQALAADPLVLECVARREGERLRSGRETLAGTLARTLALTHLNFYDSRRRVWCGCWRKPIPACMPFVPPCRGPAARNRLCPDWRSMPPGVSC